jgi:hypothetical protein
MTKSLDTSIDHSSLGVGNVLSQYEAADKFKNLLSVLLDKTNEFEGQFDLFKTTLDIENAAGVNLDNIGDLLGAPSRGASSDDDYRSLLYALIVAYNATGTASEIIQAASLIIDAEEIKIVEAYNAGFAIEIKNLSSGNVSQANDIIRIAKGAGIEFIKTTVTNYTPYFGFEEDTDPDSGTFDLAIATDQYTPFDYSQTFFSETILRNVVSGNLAMVFVLPDNAKALALKSAINWDSSNGYVSLYDSNGDFWEFTRSTATGSYSFAPSVACELILETGGTYPTPGTPQCTVKKNGVATTIADVLSFQKWELGQQAAFDAANPNGIRIAVAGPFDLSGAGYYSLLID